MAQGAAYELNAGQSECSASIGVRAVFPAEAHRVWIDPDHAGMGDGGARDIGAQILQSAGSGTSRLDVPPPSLCARAEDRPANRFPGATGRGAGGRPLAGGAGREGTVVF